jgi:hypothetical protein
MVRKIAKLQQGDRFGKLVVVSEFPAANKRGHAVRMVEAVCDCGARREARVHNLVNGSTRSCGCSQSSDGASRSRHGAAGSKLYGTWKSLRNRCFNPRNARYKDYGARGITVDERWAEFPAFRDWALASGFKPGLTVDRVDVDGPYAPENCRLVPMAAQARNRRDTVRLEAFGQTKLALEWAEDPRCSVSARTLRGRVQRGWPAEAAISRPSRAKTRSGI